jgi:putative nucleotidyltransferase with HDIG domain
VFRLLIRIKRIIKRKLRLGSTAQNGDQSKNRYLYKGLLIVTVSLIITLAYPQQLVYQPVELPRLGDIATENIVAPFDFEVRRSQEQVERDINEALANMPLIVSYDFTGYEKVYRNVVNFFSAIQSLKQANIPLANSVDSLKKLAPNLNIATLRDVFMYDSLDLMENRALNTIEALYVKGILPDTTDLSDLGYNRVIIRKRLQEIESSADSLLRRSSVGAQVTNLLKADSLPDFSSQGFAEIMAAFSEPNLAVNMSATNANKNRVLDEIPHVERAFKAGEIIIARNTRVDAWHVTALEALTQKRIDTGEEGSIFQWILPYLGRGALIIFILSMLAVFFAYYKNKKVFTNQRFTALLLVLGIEIFFVYLIDYKLNLSVYLIPFAIGAILVTVLFDLESGIISTLAISFVIGIIQNFNFSMALIAFLSGTTAAIAVQTVHKRSDFYRPVLYLIVLYLLAIYLLESLKFAPAESIVRELGFGVINSVLSPIIAMGILPIFESIFSITTDLTLLELSDMNHPLLRRLALEAPGTYHHSIVVGNLCEKAAEAIGANPLLARVGTYYHDIGKMEIPEYFVENATGNKSKHDSLSPSMSALIISSHVKKGLELAEQEDLPEIIMDFIAEHHGTTLMDFFYHKATELAGENSAEEVPESEYRYPGPRPHSKETAILMLADSVEAASRTLDDPKPSRVRNLVKRIINDKFQSGQLSDSELTMRDLSIMEDAFTQMLLGIFHKRIDYPQKEEKTQ